MGGAAAWQLVASGRSVVGLEQFEPGHHRGSSHGATRIFRVAYRDSRYVEFATAALPLWRELEDLSNEVLLEQVGQLDHGDSRAISEVAENLRLGGFSAEELAPAEAAERWPGMRFDEAVVVSKDGGRVWADRTVQALARVATAMGADLRYSTPVIKIELVGNEAVVHSDNHTWVTPLVVVSAGAWVEHVLGQIIELPALQVISEQPSHFVPNRVGLEWPSFLHHSPDAAGSAGLGFAAYGLETPGLGVKVGGFGTSAPTDPQVSESVDPLRAKVLSDYVNDWFPGLDPKPIDTTTCLFTSTADEHFVLDRRGPVVVCSPCSGHGFKFVPAVGQAVVNLANGGSTNPAWRLPR